MGWTNRAACIGPKTPERPPERRVDRTLKIDQARDRAALGPTGLTGPDGLVGLALWLFTRCLRFELESASVWKRTLGRVPSGSLLETALPRRPPDAFGPSVVL